MVEGHPGARHRARLGASSGSRSAAASLRSWTAREQQPRHFLDKQRYAGGAVHHCRQGSAAYRDRGRCDLRLRRSATRISSACHDEPDIEVLFRQQFRRDLRTDRFTLEFARSFLRFIPSLVHLGERFIEPDLEIQLQLQLLLRTTIRPHGTSAHHRCRRPFAGAPFE